MKNLFIRSALLALFVGFTPAQADTLLIDVINESASNDSNGIPRPHRGMKMADVKEKFGTPSLEHPWVGEPPITRWDYDGYSVFFEHNIVLTTVIHR